MSTFLRSVREFVALVWVLLLHDVAATRTNMALVGCTPFLKLAVGQSFCSLGVSHRTAPVTLAVFTVAPVLV